VNILEVSEDIKINLSDARTLLKRMIKKVQRRRLGLTNYEDPNENIDVFLETE